MVDDIGNLSSSALSDKLQFVVDHRSLKAATN